MVHLREVRQAQREVEVAQIGALLREQPDRCRLVGSSPAILILTEISETLQWWGRRRMRKIRDGRAAARARAAADSAQAADPREMIAN